MTERIADIARRLVVGHKRDGRCVYDEKAKRELVELYHQTGVSVAKLARDCGVNANLLTSWIRGRERKKVIADAAGGDIVDVPAAPPAFMPVRVEPPAPPPALPPAVVTMNVQARLPNGVVVDLQGCDLREAGHLLEALGRLRCSASTKG
jgi:transposase